MGLFGIGTWQPIVGGTVYAGGFPTQAFSLTNPFAGTYGGTYGFVLDTRIRAPKITQYFPAGLLGLDGTGTPISYGFPQMSWTYSSLRPDYWYYLQNTYLQAGRASPPYQYLVLVQYPDVDGANTPVQVLCRMDPPTHSYRNVGAVFGVTLTWTYVGQAQLLGSVPIITLS